MLTPEEFRTHWPSEEEPLCRFPEETTNDLNIPDDCKVFLNEAGLPESAAPFLEFRSPEEGPLKTAAEARQLSSDFDRYRVIGFDDAGNPLCLDERERGAVVYLDHDNRLQRVFMNSSIQQLAESLLAFEKMIRDTQEQNGEDAYLDGDIPETVRVWVRAELEMIDASAVADGCFWASQLAFLEPES